MPSSIEDMFGEPIHEEQMHCRWICSSMGMGKYIQHLSLDTVWRTFREKTLSADLPVMTSIHKVDLWLPAPGQSTNDTHPAAMKNTQALIKTPQNKQDLSAVWIGIGMVPTKGFCFHYVCCHVWCPSLFGPTWWRQWCSKRRRWSQKPRRGTRPLRTSYMFFRSICFKCSLSSCCLRPRSLSTEPSSFSSKRATRPLKSSKACEIIACGWGQCSHSCPRTCLPQMPGSSLKHTSTSKSLISKFQAFFWIKNLPAFSQVDFNSCLQIIEQHDCPMAIVSLQVML